MLRDEPSGDADLSLEHEHRSKGPVLMKIAKGKAAEDENLLGAVPIEFAEKLGFPLSSQNWIERYILSFNTDLEAGDLRAERT